MRRIQTYTTARLILIPLGRHNIIEAHYDFALHCYCILSQGTSATTQSLTLLLSTTEPKSHIKLLEEKFYAERIEAGRYWIALLPFIVVGMRGD